MSYAKSWERLYDIEGAFYWKMLISVNQGSFGFPVQCITQKMIFPRIFIKPFSDMELYLISEMCLIVNPNLKIYKYIVQFKI